MTAVRSYYENADDCPYFLIKPDPRCPECAAIMVWRSAHRWIAITNGAEIKLSDYGWESRHLHMGDARDAHHKIRVERASKERARKKYFVASPEALQMGSRLDKHHVPETNGRMSVCRRCGARTDGPKGLHLPDERQLDRAPRWLDAQSLSSGIDRAKSRFNN